jgi:response regulator RpfG family c-di-GMP phosphodiesterase
MTSKVLCVDDNPNVLAALKRNLRKRFDLDTAEGGELALEMMDRDGPYSVIVADMQMPGMNGIELLTRARRKAPDTVRIMLTGNADQRTPVDAVNVGHIFLFLNKPCPVETMVQALEDGIKQYHLTIAERELLENTLNGSVKALMDVLGLVDPVSFGRSQKMRYHARQVAVALGVKFTWELELSTLLSQIGIVSLPPNLVEKVRRGLQLNAAEEEMLRRVPQVGADLLANIPRLESVARIVRYQEKHFDGRGVPADSLKDEQIPLESRIIKVLTDLIQLESGTTNGKPEAMEEMRSRAGWYDPTILDAAAQFFQLAPTSSSQPRTNVRARTIAELRPGDVLRSDVRTKDDILIAASGNRISPLQLERLRNFAAVMGLKEPVYIEGG